MFELKDVSVTKAGHPVLQNVDLRVEAGERVALVGPSGGGKSSLVRLLVGLDSCDTGQVLYKGQRLTPARLPELRANLGYVIQEGGLFPHLSARDNAAMPARQRGWDAARTDARIAELTELTGLEAAALSRPPSRLSGGQRQRVALMRALLIDPEALLLDEPLGALDPVTRHRLQDDLHGIFERLNKTVVLVSHDLAEAAYLASSLAVVAEGRVVQQGSYGDLRDSPATDDVRALLNSVRALPDTDAQLAGDVRR